MSKRKPPAAARIVGAGLRALSLVSPRIAGSTANQVMFRTTRAPVRSSHQQLMSEATRSSLIVRGKRVVVYEWGSGPHALLVHGWASRASDLAMFVQPMRDRGYHVIAFDSVGHGDSEGNQTDIRDWVAILRQLSERYGAMDLALGHSLGALAINYTLTRCLESQRAVFVSPPAHFSDTVVRASELMGFSGKTAEQFYLHVARRFGDYGETLEEISEVFATPTPKAVESVDAIVIHDADDNEIPYVEGQTLARRWNVPLQTTRGHGHRRIIRAPEVLAIVEKLIGGQIGGQADSLEPSSSAEEG